MNFDFKNQTAIVTGGTRGIGGAVTSALLKAGARVIATYKSDQKNAERFLADNEIHKPRLEIKNFDVSDYQAVENFYRHIDDTVGNFQILVHCSGIRHDSVVGLMKASDWTRVLETNLTGTFNVCKLALQNLISQRYGRIIVLTSPIGRFGFAGQSNYAASKAGQVAFMKSLSKEVASRKITVNCVSPGFIDTEFIADLSEKQRKAYMDSVPMRRFGKADEVARAILFLASSESSYITGSVLDVTGGL